MNTILSQKSKSGKINGTSAKQAAKALHRNISAKEISVTGLRSAIGSCKGYIVYKLKEKLESKELVMECQILKKRKCGFYFFIERKVITNANE